MRSLWFKCLLFGGGIFLSMTCSVLASDSSTFTPSDFTQRSFALPSTFIHASQSLHAVDPLAFHVEPISHGFQVSMTPHALLYNETWVGEWQVLATPTTEVQIGFGVTHIALPEVNLESSPVIYALYYEQQWFDRYTIKPHIQYIHTQHQSFTAKEAIIFGLSTQISF